MDTINQIKLNIWGIRGGFRSFCHSEDLDINEPEINNTWKDIRDFVYVSDLSVRFYALEFTPTYKVFTIYRPVNDTSRTGAYVATTLYVPHGIKVNHVMGLLQQISDAYHKDHYDAFGNPNANPDYVQIYVDIINNYAANVDRESKKRSWPASTQDNTPKILPYNDINVVEKFFAEPYRREFLLSQEVMFWKNDIFGDPQSYGVKFQRLNDNNCFSLNGSNIKEQFNGGQIKNQPSGFAIEKFMLDGRDITYSWTSAFFDDADEIEIKMSKSFHEAKTYCDTMIGIGSPFVKRGTDYEFGSVYFDPRQYSARVIVPTDVAGKDFDLYVNNSPIPIESGSGNVSFYGNEIDSVKKFSLRYGNASFPVKEMRMKELFADGNDTPASLSINMDNLKRIKFEFDKPSKGMLSINGQKFSFDTGVESYWEVVLPADLRTDANSFVFDVDELDAKVEAKNSTTFKVILTSKYFYAGISFEQGMENFVDYNCFKFKTRGSTYLSSFGFKFKLPQNEKTCVKNKDGVLGVVVSNGQTTAPCEYEIKTGNEECEILMKPNLALYYNESGATVTLSSEKGASVNIPANKRLVLPVMKWILKDSKGDKDSCEMKEETNCGCRQFTIRKKEVASTQGSIFEVSNSQGSGSYGHTSTGTTNNPPAYGSTSYGSSGQGERKQNRNKSDYLCYYYNDGEQPVAVNGTLNVFGSGDSGYKCFTIKDLEKDRQLMLCYHIDNTPFLEKTNEVCAQNNIKNGFEVGLNGEGFYAVKDVMDKSEKKGGNKGKDDKKKWIILGCLAGVLLLAGAGLLIWKPWAGKKADCYVQIEMTHETIIENVVPNPQTELVGQPIVSGTTAKIALYNGWKGLSLQVITRGEGRCEDVKLKEVGEGGKPLVDPQNITNRWSIENNTLTITLESPAWKELKDKGTTIENYVAIVEKYTSSSVREECSKRAYELISDFSDTISLGAFIKGFEDIDKDKARVCRDSLASIKKRQETAKTDAEIKRQNLADFKTKLGTVYSINCTMNEIRKLQTAYNKVVNEDWKTEAGKVIRNKDGNLVKPSQNDFLQNLIDHQTKFFDIFTKPFPEAQGLVNDLVNNHTQMFSSEQRRLMKHAVENGKEKRFNWYKNTKGNRKDYYKYINDNLDPDTGE